MAKYFVTLLLGLLIAIGWFVYKNPAWFHLSSVSISGDFVHMSKQEVMAKVKPMLVGNLWQINVRKMQKTLQDELVC